MTYRRWLVSLLTVVVVGCCLFHPPPPPAPPPIREYRARDFQWSNVNRVLVLPLCNEAAFYPVAEEVRTALAAELQALGRFEVVAGPCNGPAADLVAQVRVAGRFNEAALIELAHLFRADVIVLATVTQYSPYRPPRLGLAVQAVSPFDAVVVASVDGLWDTAFKATADLACASYCEAFAPRQTSTASVLVLDSPRLFQRFVCGQVARALAGFEPAPAPPAPPQATQPVQPAPPEKVKEPSSSSLP